MNKSNLPYIINYIFILFAFILGGIFFRQAFFALLIIILVVLPIISIFILRFTARNITVDTFAKTASITRNNKIIITVSLSNKGRIPFLNCNLFFTYNNMFYPTPLLQCISLPAIPKRPSVNNISFDASHLGIAEFLFSELLVTDFLHLYSIKIPVNQYIRVPVMPIETSKNYTNNIPPFLSLEDDEQYTNYGQLTHDLKETREYRPGDSLKDIHWKLSAKNDELTVKEFERSADRSLLLLGDLFINNLDATIETLYSFSLSLIKNKEYFKILIFNANEKSFDIHTIENRDDLESAILKMYYSAPYKIRNLALNTFFEVFGEDRGIIFILGNDISLHINQGNEMPILENKEID